MAQGPRPEKERGLDFEANGFKPGIFWGTLILVVEFGGGLAILLGLDVWVAAALMPATWRAFGPGKYALA